MRALICDRLIGLEGLEVRSSVPPVPGPDEILVEVVSAGLNHRDLLIIEGRYQLRGAPPFTPGCEVAGTVALVGNKVQDFCIGDRVVAHVGNGGFAEQVTCAAAHACKLPDDLPIGAAGGLTVCHSTALLGLQKIAGLKVGQRLLVLGAAGGAGFAAIETGLALGAQVIAVTSSADKSSLLQEATGCEVIICNEDGFAPALAARRGFDCVFDTLGGNYSEACLKALKPGGTQLIVGFATGGIPALPLDSIAVGQVSVTGLSWGGWVAENRAGQRSLYEQLFKLWRKGQIMRLPTVRVSLEDYAIAFSAMQARSQAVKFCLSP